MAKKVLLVEDDKFLRGVLEKKLLAENINIESAQDGQEAIDKIINSPPDLILLDIILPKKSGYEVLDEIHKDPNLAKIPVVILSNLGQGEDIEKVKALGVVDYFVKASTPLDQLITKIKQLVSQLSTG